MESLGRRKTKMKGKGKGRRKPLRRKAITRRRKAQEGQRKPDSCQWTVFDLDPPRHRGPAEQKQV